MQNFLLIISTDTCIKEKKKNTLGARPVHIIFPFDAAQKSNSIERLLCIITLAFCGLPERPVSGRRISVVVRTALLTIHVSGLEFQMARKPHEYTMICEAKSEYRVATVFVKNLGNTGMENTHKTV